jgi:hypothetical protein
MRKGLLAVLSIGLGCVCLAVFACCIAWQCLGTRSHLQQLPLKKEEVFPMTVEDTPLAVLQMLPYQGPFWEDGMETTVDQVAALLVENTGGEFVSRGAVVLQWESATLVFEVYLLPPGERVLVLEKQRQKLPQLQLQRCYGWSQGEYPEYIDQVAVEEAGGVTMAVVNRSDEWIPLVQVCYKTRNQESGVFIGGIAYTVEIRNLRPGERRLITPYRYVCGNSQVVRIQTMYE